MLEYDDERSGSFLPLQVVPDDKMVVLGLVTTKNPRLETRDELKARLKQAGEYFALDRLAISPQCGFSTSVVGNAITTADQAAKLRLLVETAAEVWGD